MEAQDVDAESSRAPSVSSTRTSFEGHDSGASSTGTRSFSEDPSPFSGRPTLPTDSSAYRELVATAAYYRAQQRGFAPGGEIDDWLNAEREVAARLGEQRPAT